MIYLRIDWRATAIERCSLELIDEPSEEYILESTKEPGE